MVSIIFGQKCVCVGGGVRLLNMQMCSTDIECCIHVQFHYYRNLFFFKSTMSVPPPFSKAASDTFQILFIWPLVSFYLITRVRPH